jgi:hypothetical protein
MRPVESNDYLYSFAGASAGTSSDQVKVVFRTMFEVAIGELMKGYTDKQIHAAVLAAANAATTNSTPIPSKI